MFIPTFGALLALLDDDDALSAAVHSEVCWFCKDPHHDALDGTLREWAKWHDLHTFTESRLGVDVAFHWLWGTDSFSEGTVLALVALLARLSSSVQLVHAMHAITGGQRGTFIVTAVDTLDDHLVLYSTRIIGPDGARIEDEAITLTTPTVDRSLLN